MSQTIKCTCGNDLVLTGEPVIEVVNQLSFASVVVNFANMGGRKCTRCGADHVLGIHQVDFSGIKMGFVNVPAKEKPSGLILPPGLRTN